MYSDEFVHYEGILISTQRGPSTKRDRLAQSWDPRMNHRSSTSVPSKVADTIPMFRYSRQLWRSTVACLCIRGWCPIRSRNCLVWVEGIFAGER